MVIFNSYVKLPEGNLHFIGDFHGFPMKKASICRWCSHHFPHWNHGISGLWASPWTIPCDYPSRNGWCWNSANRGDAEMPNVMVISWKNCQMTCKIFYVFKPNLFNKYVPCIFDFCEIQLIRIFGQRFRHPRLISPAAELALHHEFLGLYRYDAKKKGYRLYGYTFILCVFHRKREREKRKEIILYILKYITFV